MNHPPGSLRSGLIFVPPRMMQLRPAARHAAVDHPACGSWVGDSSEIHVEHPMPPAPSCLRCRGAVRFPTTGR